MLRASLAACLLLLSACGSVPQRSTQGSLDQLAAWMTGTFSSASQAAADPAHFFDIRLIMVPIWEDLAQGDERWLYVEQAAIDRDQWQTAWLLTGLPGPRPADVA